MTWKGNKYWSGTPGGRSITHMKTTLRPSAERGHANHGWLDSHHTFSFADYYDPAHMGFRSLRVINEDHVAAGMGFGMHPHRDMEIVSYIVDGALTHRDSMGHTETVSTGGVQYMSAGSGVSHSEFNGSHSAPVHLLQIWIQPNERGLEPAYREWKAGPQNGPLRLVAAPDGSNGVIPIRQDARLFPGKLAAGESASHSTSKDRGLWLQLISGRVNAAGKDLAPGDGLAIEDAEAVQIAATEPSEFLLFDLR
jgi:quercetin 2,3-dioxygenase